MEWSIRYSTVILIAVGLCWCDITSIDPDRVNAGKKEYELIQQRSEMPRYGTCWKNAMVRIQTGCKRLTDDVQSRLALAYLNCFLKVQGRDIYECGLSEPVHKCTANMKDVDRGSFTIFFTHTQNICYFLQAQVWHENTETTIDRLSVTSFHVASKLEESYDLQNKLLKQQNESMKTQEQILENAANLSGVISQSSDNIHSMFEDFKKTTHEQRMLITDVFDRISKLQHMVLGEFSSFYSVIYYTLSIIVCYLLTSTSRTSSARFWLFGIMTLNVLMEQSVVTWHLGLFKAGEYKNDEEMIYSVQKMLRKVSTFVSVLVLAVCAYRYQDLATANNQLLVEIRKQNSDLKKLMIGSSNLNSNLDLKAAITSSGKALADSTILTSSDSAVSSGESDFEDEESDHTFILDNYSGESETDSWCTSLTETPNTPTKSSLASELHDLRQATPLRELSTDVQAWISTGYFNSPNHSDSRSRISRSTNPVQNASMERKQYFLRPRKPLILSPNSNPALQVESPRSFTRTVQQLERLAYKNSILARAMIRRQLLDESST